MVGAKSASILSFFKPAAKQTPSKRPFLQESPSDKLRRRSKSPRTSHTHAHAPQTQSSSRNDKQYKSQQATIPSHNGAADSSELSRSISSSDSDTSDTIVVVHPSDTSFKSSHESSGLSTRQDLNGSFSTTSVPPSHRIEKNGEAIVTGSDDDSDELLDLDHLLDRKPLKPKPLPQHHREHDARSKSGRRQRPVYEDTSAADQAKFNEVMEKAKNDLAKSREQQKALDQANELAKESLEGSSIENLKATHLTTETILSRVGELDREKAEKFAQAIERTELAQSTRYWSFFDSTVGNSKRKQATRKWPEIHDQSEWSKYQDSADRELAFTGGVFEQAAADRQLPPEILVWILSQSFTELQLDMSDAYRLVLKHADNCISSDQILKAAESILHRMGATIEAMSISSDQIQPQIPSKDRPGPSPTPRESLNLWLQNMRALMRMMSLQDLARILDILFLLSLDSAIPNDTLTLFELQTTIKECIEHLAEDPNATQILQQSSQRIFYKAGDVHFRLQFLRCLPISSNTLSLLRRDFARAAFYEDSSRLNPRPELTSLQQLGAVLKGSERFQLTKKTDYQDIPAYIACFDMAIGAGEQTDLVDSTSIAQFDAVIDELIEIVRVKHARIHTIGAVHMLRTEVKDALTTIEKRLSFSVRTQRKQRRHAFDQRTLKDMYKK